MWQFFQANKSPEDIYATPSIDASQGFRTISLSTLRNYSREPSNRNSEDLYSKKRTNGGPLPEEGIYGYRKSNGNCSDRDRINSTEGGFGGDSKVSAVRKTGGKEESISEVPSSMALIVPYKSQSVMSGNHSSDLYKPLKSFGNYSQSSFKANGTQRSSGPFSQSFSDNKFPSRSSEVNGRRSASVSTPILEEGEESPYSGKGMRRIQNGEDINKRISRSSEEMMDVEVSSSSSSSTSSDAIYSSIKKDRLGASSTASEEDSEPIYLSIPQNPPASSRPTRNFTVFRNNLINRNDGITDTMAIICTGKQSSHGKGLSQELTSTFKPVETSM